jgi:hypothetical protein
MIPWKVHFLLVFSLLVTVFVLLLVLRSAAASHLAPAGEMENGFSLLWILECLMLLFKIYRFLIFSFFGGLRVCFYLLVGVFVNLLFNACCFLIV